MSTVLKLYRDAGALATRLLPPALLLLVARMLAGFGGYVIGRRGPPKA